MMIFYYTLFVLISLKEIVNGQKLIDKNSMTIKSSSTHSNHGQGYWNASKALDGSNASQREPDTCHCCAATKREWEPWYRVDLGHVYNINRVEVFGRLSFHSLRNIKVTYGINSFNETEMFTNPQDVFVVNHKVEPSPQPGRYIELTFMHITQHFVICELNVYEACKNGTYGSNCSNSCGNCLNGVPCDKDTGKCQSCAAGYNGEYCKEECPPGKYGPDCRQKCGQCKKDDHCNRFNGSCTECQKGFMIPLCTECIEGFYEEGNTCTRCGYCLNGATCDQETGSCQSCEAGYKGSKCKQVCASGEYGRDCTGKCGQCKSGEPCDRFNGTCTECQEGFVAPLCKVCKRGKYGQNCDLTCGFCRDGHTCDSETGHCSAGCTDGYNGTLCTTKCSSGTFGKNCGSTCGNCSDNDVCRFDNGHCEQGCIPGLLPPTCLTECEDGIYGQNCSEECGECQNGEACNKDNGTCKECAPNYQAPFCHLRLSLNSPEPGDVSISPFIGAFLAVLVGVSIIITFFYLRRRKNNQSREKLPDTQNRIVTESKPATTTISAQKPVTAKKKNSQLHEKEATGTTNEDDSSNIYYNILAKKTDLKICQLWDYIYLKKKEQCGMFFQEYAQIDNSLRHPHDTALLSKNRELNRYRGIVAYDHSRVKLQIENDSDTDYINACFIDGYEKSRKFIASQGPTKSMKNDFWRMVWQQKSKFIVMVTNLIELGKEKCVLYWPKDKDDEVTFGKITVALVSEHATTDFTVRHLEIYKGTKDEKRAVTQYHFQAWPDKSTPDSTWSLVKFWRTVTEDIANVDDRGPIVVHCSAGIGRTGSYIAFDIAYNKARSEGTVKVREVVTTLRDQRVGMVQKEEQYVYIHEAIADAFLFGTHYIWSNQFEELYDFLKQPMDGIHTTRLETQFNNILESIEDKKAIEFSTEENENIYNNVFNKRTMLPPSGENYRPKSKSLEYVQEIGALILPKGCQAKNEFRKKSFLANTTSTRTPEKKVPKNHEEKGTFIISKSPESSRMTEFWSLVQEQNVKTIVSIKAQPEENSKRFSICEIRDSSSSDKIRLTLVEERTTSVYTERKLMLKNKENPDVKITHFEYNDWNMNANIPRDASSMFQLIEAVLNCQRQFSETEPILVYCKSGFKQCGLVCVLLSEINRMIREGSQINIIHTVKTMKERHNDIIGTYDQYQYIYDVILEHVRDSTYQNQ